ncbi:20139_t:CDS:2 [Cetraspora pellucida]|uniref:20139_t:CDS:1 n=1 Tax=Cetraspora pellucida TaxID=1433469 RepID=A0A9N8ZCY4_9GLOM|nr:20139_t:CDS:2 [Cetraspora pellucida]
MSDQLLTYISELFKLFYRNNILFEGINIVLVSDLAQLPSISESSKLKTTFNTTHVVGYRKNANLINKIMLMIISTQENKFMISNSIDIFDNQVCDNNSKLHEFKNKTNLPKTIRIQLGARVKFFNNS